MPETPRLDPELIAEGFRDACRQELAALKPGNVHVHSPGHGLEVRDFELSADAAAPHIAARGARVGARIRAAVEATWGAVATNTNLGIVLLCAPLAAAAETARRGETLRCALARAGRPRPPGRDRRVRGDRARQPGRARHRAAGRRRRRRP